MKEKFSHPTKTPWNRNLMCYQWATLIGGLSFFFSFFVQFAFFCLCGFLFWPVLDCLCLFSSLCVSLLCTNLPICLSFYVWVLFLPISSFFNLYFLFSSFISAWSINQKKQFSWSLTNNPNVWTHFWNKVGLSFWLFRYQMFVSFLKHLVSHFWEINFSLCHSPATSICHSVFYD